MTKIHKKISGKIVFALIIMISLLNCSTAYAITQTSEISRNYDDKSIMSSIVLKEDQKTNLLEDESLLEINDNGKLYDLDSVTVTRHRQKVRIEYYVGDYNASTFIGEDEGYADFEDASTEYIMDISSINEKFGQSIPLSYKIVPYEQGTYFPWIPSYKGSETTFVLKVLLAQTQKYSFSITKYQNRQDVLNPDPVGKTRSEISALTEYWRYSTNTRTVEAVKGQNLNIASIGMISATDTSPKGRKGDLAYLGLFRPEDSVFVKTDTFTAGDSTGTTYLAAFYQVDDYGSPVVDPGYTGGMISTATITFVGETPGWKPETTSETLYVNKTTDNEKLKAYPFDYAGDAFDSPEYAIYYVQNNWMLAHKISLAYNYVPALTSNVNVRYEDTEGNILDRIVIVGRVGSEYITSSKEFEGYTLKNVPANATGVHDITDIDVVYIYEKNNTIMPPKTSDNTPVAILLICLIIAVSTICILIKRMKKTII